MTVPRWLAFGFTIAAVVTFPYIRDGIEHRTQTFTTDDFSLDMPGTPDRSETSIPTPNGSALVTTYVTQVHSRAFGVSVVEFPQAGGFDLDGAVQGMAANVHGTVRSVATTSYQGHPARDVRIGGARHGGGPAATVIARIIRTERLALTVECILPGEDATEPGDTCSRMMSSLKINADGGRRAMEDSTSSAA